MAGEQRAPSFSSHLSKDRFHSAKPEEAEQDFVVRFQ